MFYRINLRGETPLIQNCGTKGLDTRSALAIEKQEITRKKAGNLTVADEDRLREIDCYRSFWEDEKRLPTIPPAAIRKVIENAARKLKDGPQVREGLLVMPDVEFKWDEKLGKTLKKLSKTVQFTVPVVRNRGNRVLATRAKFDEWSVAFTVEVDEELVDQGKLVKWLDIAGRRIGLGDWRPHLGGTYGRFIVESVREVEP